MSPIFFDIFDEMLNKSIEALQLHCWNVWNLNLSVKKNENAVVVLNARNSRLEVGWLEQHRLEETAEREN